MYIYIYIGDLPNCESTLSHFNAYILSNKTINRVCLGAFKLCSPFLPTHLSPIQNRATENEARSRAIKSSSLQSSDLLSDILRGSTSFKQGAQMLMVMTMLKKSFNIAAIGSPPSGHEASSSFQNKLFLFPKHWTHHTEINMSYHELHFSHSKMFLWEPINFSNAHNFMGGFSILSKHLATVL